ncbi:hypothetical protein Hanom_Chr04g00324681 [Helianthus anomalus]
MTIQAFRLINVSTNENDIYYEVICIIYLLNSPIADTDDEIVSCSSPSHIFSPITTLETGTVFLSTETSLVFTSKNASFDSAFGWSTLPTISLSVLTTMSGFVSESVGKFSNGGSESRDSINSSTDTIGSKNPSSLNSSTINSCMKSVPSTGIVISFSSASCAVFFFVGGNLVNEVDSTETSTETPSSCSIST